jgi:hypothetical protein
VVRSQTAGRNHTVDGRVTLEFLVPGVQDAKETDLGAEALGVACDAAVLFPALVWVDGFLNGLEVRESLELKDWEKAQQKIREWEAEGKPTAVTEELSIAQARDAFKKDAVARGLQDTALKKYRCYSNSLKRLAPFVGPASSSSSITCQRYGNSENREWMDRDKSYQAPPESKSNQPAHNAIH